MPENHTPLHFEVLSQSRSSSSRSRAGLLKLTASDGRIFEIKTPAFMPVGTSGSVKSISPKELREVQAEIILGNTYHLYLRPGHRRIEKLGELAKFMSWDGPILTDSGGFQVFSLAALNQIDDDGVTFQSHIDGSRHRFTAEISMEIQRALGSQIVMAFDQCPPYPSSIEEVSRAMQRTLQWAKRGLEVPLKKFQARFGIVQGGLYEDFRNESASEMTALPFDGFAIGGLSIGEKPELMQKMAAFTAAMLPDSKPKYLMGVGRPEDLVECVRAGVDLFDCVMPTRNARNGQLFTSRGKINIKNAKFSEDSGALDDKCPCETCCNYTKAYLRHLFIAKELLGARLASLHNLTFYVNLMCEMRIAIIENRFDEWANSFYTGFHNQKGFE